MARALRSRPTVGIEAEPPTVRSRRDRAVARLAARARWYRSLAELYQRQLGSCRRAGVRMTAAVRSFETDIAWLKAEVAVRDEELRALRGLQGTPVWAAVSAYTSRPTARGLLGMVRVALRFSGPRAGSAGTGG